MENTTKSIFLSKTVIGIVIAGLGMIAPVLQAKFGITVTADDGMSILNSLDSIMQAGGLLLALYGRVKATKKIG